MPPCSWVRRTYSYLLIQCSSSVLSTMSPARYAASSTPVTSVMIAWMPATSRLFRLTSKKLNFIFDELCGLVPLWLDWASFSRVVLHYLNIGLALPSGTRSAISAAIGANTSLE